MSEVLKLVLTGMGTVFFILIMVVLLGNLIIRITNTFSPAVTVQASSNAGSSEIEPAKLAAIVSAVESVTRGKGRVTSVEKIDN
ncbi:OadG family protein [Maribellus mangrovi]|uniref:OadG family protein n=1 Tax=Maribellus mangrovi TaxID=3133146 RepID=UPI0030EF0401